MLVSALSLSRRVNHASPVGYNLLIYLNSNEPAINGDLNHPSRFANHHLKLISCLSSKPTSKLQRGSTFKANLRVLIISTINLMQKKKKNAGCYRSTSAFLVLFMATMKILSEFYPGRLHRAFVVDPPSHFSFLWKVGDHFLLSIFELSLLRCFNGELSSCSVLMAGRELGHS